jgi:excinuclease UvrABC nuclease subunit
VLYLGKAKNLHQRWGGHEKHPVLKKYYGVRLYYQVCLDDLDARRLEAKEIAELKPLLNGRNESMPCAPWRDLRDWVVRLSLLGVLGMVFGLVLKLILR